MAIYQVVRVGLSLVGDGASTTFTVNVADLVSELQWDNAGTGGLGQFVTGAKITGFLEAYVSVPSVGNVYATGAVTGDVLTLTFSSALPAFVFGTGGPTCQGQILLTYG